MKAKELEQRLRRLEERKIQEQAILVRRGEQKQRVAKRKLAQKEAEEFEWRRNILYQMTLKDMQTAAQRAHIVNNKKLMNDRGVRCRAILNFYECPVSSDFVQNYV